MCVSHNWQLKNATPRRTLKLDFERGSAVASLHQLNNKHFPMDPPAANQKRKRGRPANTSRDDEVKNASNSITTTAHQNNQTNVDGEIDDRPMDEESRPKKRGRRAKEDVSQVPQPEISETQPSRRHRRQQSTIQMHDGATKHDGRPEPSEEVETAKRGRPRKDRQVRPPEPEPEQEEADDEDENEGNSSLLRRSKRNRRSLDDSHTATENSTASGEEISYPTDQRAAKRRKQPIRPADKEQPGEEAEPGEPGNEVDITSRAQKRQRRRPRSSQDAQPSINNPEPDIAMPQRKRGRPSRSEGGDKNSGTKLQSGSSQRREKPADEEPQAKSGRRQSSTTHQKSKGRRRPSAEQGQSPARSFSPDSDSSPPPYRHITERTRHVTHQIVESKWSSLDPSSIANIAGLLHSVSLPTLLHVVPKQYAHAEDVLGKVIRGLCKRSARLPFPPASTLPRREDELDFERTQSAVEVLLSQLNPLQHSVELLKREKERAEKELERQYKVLDRLSTNARAEARERRNRLKKVHVLVPTSIHDSVTNDIDLLPAGKATSQVFAGVQDEEMLSLAGQINNHMESMRGNLQQIDGVLPAIEKSHALLRTTLQPQFDQKQLESIMLGHVVQ
ncbi:CENP-Q, a CENPA-CAD centromere complex subunit-domain-containing protein [Xylaria castorea]|nr:CENP-Q, a CENPA-CAD centromere complex subunit-domain-containing protein [Xylaria castorea]